MPQLFQPELFTSLPRPTTDWRPPPELPDLSRHRELFCDEEYDGLDPFKSRVIGWSVALPELINGTRRKFYLPIGHRGGGNLDKEQVIRWANSEQGFKGKDLWFLNAKTDCKMSRNTGVDYELLGCRLHDVAFKAALLNDNRGYGGLDLESLLIEYCGVKKGELGKFVDKNRMAETHSSEVGPYAERDADGVFMLHNVTEPQIKKENLERVLALEDALIYCVCEMERNGLRLDITKLARWDKEIQAEYERIILEVWRRTGLRVNPDSPPDMAALFRARGLQTPELTEKGEESFSAYAIEKTNDEVALMALRARRMASLRSKYVKKFLREAVNGVLYYQLHQLKSDKEGYGTMSGRFSGTNMSQQILRVNQQMKRFGPDWIIREAVIPEPGYVSSSADADQIEFRLFVHYTQSERLIQYYRDDPHTDFHNITTDKMTSPSFMKLDYSNRRATAKVLNFGEIYGLSNEESAAEQLECSVEEARELMAAYDKDMPEVKRLLKFTMNLAARRGWVRTLLMRRARFPEKKRLHSALNRVIQGSAADLNKLKLLRAYNERKTLGIHKLRLTLHDEIFKDQDPDPEYKRREEEMLNEQEIELSVPILWSVGQGLNWKEAK